MNTPSMNEGAESIKKGLSTLKMEVKKIEHEQITSENQNTLKREHMSE